MNMVITPMTNAMNLPEILKTTSISELDEAFSLMKKSVYAFPYKKATYKIAEVLVKDGQVVFQFVDHALEVDSFCLPAEELPEMVKLDLLIALKLTT